MATKVQKNYNGAIPQWLLDQGAEVFSNKGKTYLVINNQRVEYNQAPENIRQFFEEMFEIDTESRRKIRITWGLLGTEAFEKWLFCKFGGIDKSSDFIEGKLVPDTYNNVCTEINCPLRGKLCGQSSRLSATDVQTLSALSRGQTIDEAANRLFVSIPGLKSRINTLREKTGARNMAQLIAGFAGLSTI